LYTGVMAFTEMISASLSAYGLREPFLGARLKPQLGFRRDMILSPLLAGLIFLVAAGMTLAGLVRAAHWSLILIIPAMAFFGSRTHKLSNVGVS
jgi:hypothetical protein